MIRDYNLHKIQDPKKKGLQEFNFDNVTLLSTSPEDCYCSDSPQQGWVYQATTGLNEV